MSNHVSGARQLFSLEGRAALVTGASAGIGARFARVLHDAGANVAVVARRGDVLADVIADLPRCTPVVADLSDAVAVERAHREATDAVGELDILVNNAAFIAGGVAAEDETPEQIDTTLRVNLIAPILLAQLSYPAMKARGAGSIVNVSSIVARAGIGRLPQATYAASKGALEAITREWAAQWSRHGVRVNCIAPGFIETEMTGPIIDQERIQSWIRSNSMIPRHGQPDDFDGALLYLASDASAYVTGQVLVVDGGWTAR